MQTKNIKKFLQELFDDRLGVKDLKPILERASQDYGFGKLESYELNEYGFQDVNVEITTSKGKFFVKLLSRDKTDDQAASYVNLMNVIGKSKVSYPKLFKSRNNYLYKLKSEGVSIRLCVQENIDGQNFHKSGKAPTITDLRNIAVQAAYINEIDHNPGTFELDTWATMKFPEMFPVKKEALDPAELSLVEPLLEDFLKVPIKSLPLSLVHGDIIRTNVIKDKKGKIWIVDIGVASYQPRIVELAVMAHDLFLDLSSIEKTKELRILMLNEYQKIINLAPLEIKVLPTIIKITHAMYLLSAAFMDRVLGHGNSETTFWLNQSKRALKEIENDNRLSSY